MTRFPSSFGLCLLIILCISACGSPDTPPANPDVRVYEGGKGRVTDVVADGNMAIVKHDEIPGFMMGMTMTFGLREDSVRNYISVGDSIHFQVSFDGIDSWISSVRVIE